jgi:uncharacterized membrane protein YfcA
MLALHSFAFLAGLIDSIAGGGGLIQIPALLILMPNAAIPTLLGTNKFASIAGTLISMQQYATSVTIPWRTALTATVVAFISSFLGAKSVSLIRADVLRPVILVLLIVVFMYTFFQKDFGQLHAPKLTDTKQFWYGIATGAVLGFYDGFLGPGTGSFLIFTFIGIFGFDFLSASASSKVINVATNLSALLYFAFTNNIFYGVALTMAICNIIGSVVGTKLAILKGSNFIRIFFLIIVSAIIIRFAYDIFQR